MRQAQGEERKRVNAEGAGILRHFFLWGDGVRMEVFEWGKPWNDGPGPQTADSAASARNAALAVVIESCRFCAASQGHCRRNEQGYPIKTGPGFDVPQECQN
jgi:hypothetical protein